MGYVFDYKDSIAYDNWYRGRYSKKSARHHSNLLKSLLKPTAGDSIIDIGCGTGGTLKDLTDIPGLQLTGIDPSPYMLDLAKANLGVKADLHRGFAEELPFDDNSFNHACLITTLEYVNDPEKAIEEAARVAKDRLFICILNRYAIINMQRRFFGIFEKTIYNKAQFFSVWELKNIVKNILGKVPVAWRAIDIFPPLAPNFVHMLEKNQFVQKIPFGTYVGMVITLEPRYRVRPMNLKIQINGKQKFAENHYTVVKEKDSVAEQLLKQK